MALQVGGDQAFAATVTYSVAPNASFARGEVRYVEDGSSAWDTGSADALVGIAYDRSETVDYTGWNQSAGSTVAITVDLGTARTAPRFVVQGYYGTSSIFRPTAALLEHSDDNSAWTTVDDFTGLTGASGTAGAAGWLTEWDTSGSGSHQYWRVTFTHGGTWLFISRVLFGTAHSSIGRPVTASPSPAAGIPFVTWDLIRTGDSDWADDVFNQASAGARAIVDESFSNPQFFAFDQSTGLTAALTLDQGSAVAGERLVIKGYHGTNSIFRPTAVLVEYSDDNSNWTTQESKTSLTGGGTAGAAYWWTVSDIAGEVHRYWRATLTHGGQLLLVTAMEVQSGYTNLALGRPYTLSTAADANFPNNRPTEVIGPGDSDWVSGGGKLTNGERARPASFVSGTGWLLGSGATASARIDLGSAFDGDHFVVHGIHGNGGSMVTPVAVAFAHSDDDSNWTTFLTISGLTATQNAKGRWAARADVTAEGSHQYWRATVTNTTSSLFVVLSQLEFWQEAADEGITGTGASTLEDVTSDGDGTYTPPAITGTGSSTLADVTSDGSGTFTPPNITGTGASTLADVTSAGTGVYTPGAITGTGASTLQDVDSDGNGIFAPLITGTGASTLGDVTSVGVGVITASGSIGNVVCDVLLPLTAACDVLQPLVGACRVDTQ